MKKQITLVSLAVVALSVSAYGTSILLGTPGEGDSGGEAATADAWSAGPPTAVTLSADNEAYAHFSIHMGEPYMQRGKVLRAVSAASYVTVAERWQSSMTHSLEAVDASGADPILMASDYDLLPDNGGAAFNIWIHPGAGFTWGTVDNATQLEFNPECTREH